jgi:DNA-binding NarL/FixJ family response regulator
MIITANMTVLAVGVGERSAELEALPIRLIGRKSGFEAVRSFKTDQIDSVLSHWHLEDMPDGLFLRRLVAIRPQLPIIAIIEPGNPEQEIAARSLGVAAVIPEDCSEEYFREIVSAALHLRLRSVERVYAVKES